MSEIVGTVHTHTHTSCNLINKNKKVGENFVPARNKGITLVALIITIIILLILAIVTIAAISKSNIIKYAQNAQTDYKKATDNENTTLTRYEDDIQSSSKDFISKEKNYIGYYADVDGDGTVDGIIYADLAHSASGKWKNQNNDTFSYEAIENTKEYYISQTNYNGNNANGYGFGTHDVISVVSGTAGEDRFYVMALEESDSCKSVCWYYSAGRSGGSMENYQEITSTEFGSGMKNTKNILEKWNNKIWGEQDASPYNNCKDIWGIVNDKFQDGWFVPSRDEWICFCYEFYEKYKGLFTSQLWTSSICSKSSAYTLYMSYGVVSGLTVDEQLYELRLTSCF